MFFCWFGMSVTEITLVVTYRSLAMAGRVGKLASSTDPEYETRMCLAIDGLAGGTYRTISAAAKAQKVARQTLSDRVNGRHQSHRVSSETKQNLNPTEEAAMNEWLVLNSSMATPLHPRDLRADVQGTAADLTKAIKDHLRETHLVQMRHAFRDCLETLDGVL